VVSVTDPYGRILGFLDRSRYFSITQFYFCGVHPVILSHLFKNMPAITTEILLLLYFSSQHVSAPTGHLQV
jgi:hypothetical protein